MPYLGLQRKSLPSAQISQLTSGRVSLPSVTNLGEDGSWEFISGTTVSGSSTNQVSFTSLPDSYDSLVFIINGGNTSGYSHYVYYNLDTGNNYGRHRFSQYATTTTHTTGFNDQQTQGSILLGQFAGLTAVANQRYADCMIYVDNYSNSNKNTIQRHIVGSAYISGTATYYIDQESGVWNNTAVVTRIDIYGLGANWIDKSTIDLYGLRRY
jgi:hypothetical protein